MGIQMAEDKDGAVWAGGLGPSGAPPLCRIFGGKADCIGKNELFGRWIGHLYGDKQGRLWANTGNGIWRISPGQPFQVSQHSTMTRFLLGDDTGRLLFADGSDVNTVTSEGKVQDAKLYPLRANGKPIFPTCILKDREGNLWIGTDGQGLVHIHEGRVDNFSASDGLSFDSISAIMQDSEGSIWVASKDGLDRFTKPAVPRLTDKQGLSNDNVLSVLTDQNDVSWFGTPGGLDKAKAGQLSEPALQLPNIVVTSLFQTAQGHMLVATDRDKGMVWLKGDKVTPIQAPSGPNVYGIAEDGRGDLWVVDRESGLLHLSPNGVLLETFTQGELGTPVYLVATDPKRNGLWLGSRLGRLGFFKDGKLVKWYGANGELGDNMLRDIHVDSSGAVWVGTQIGLARLAEGKISVLGRKNGLPCDAVHWMRQSDDGNIWLYTECGLVSLSEADLRSWIAQSNHQVTITHQLDNTDGVPLVTYTGYYTPQVTKTREGVFLFASGTGVSFFDPRHLNQNILPPQVHIEGINTDGREIEAAGHIVLPPRPHDIHLQYTALSFAAPRKVRFRYKLEGYDTVWSPPVSLREVTYTNLPPGEYKLRVIACNNDGVWNNEGGTLDFFIPPAWYQTVLFRVLCLVLAALTSWGIFRLRVRQIEEAMSARFDERLAERTRIARELHDTFLQTIQGSKLVAVNALKNTHDPIRTGRALEQLSEWLVRANEEGRAALHSLRTSTTETNELAEGLQQALRDYRGESPMEAVFSVNGDVREMHPIVRDEIYLIGHEAIRNAYMHSAGTRLNVDLAYDNYLSLTVRDNGVGIDPAIVDAGKSGHFGMPSMRERAARIGARLLIETSPTSGTEIKVLVPGSLAFSKPRPSPLDKIKTVFHRPKGN
jgi:signal transduction histidine kinase/ligand-binding sensor domain-containing protein